VRRFVVAGALVAASVVACDSGSEHRDSLDSATSTPPTTPSIRIDSPFGTQVPWENRREGVFPVQLLIPGDEVSIWTAVRRVGEPLVDDTLTFLVEGFVEAREGYVFNYSVVIGTADGSEQEAEPKVSIGFMDTGAKRRFETSVQLPKDARVTTIHWIPADGQVSKEFIYHIDLELATIPFVQDLPGRYDEAQ